MQSIKSFIWGPDPAEQARNCNSLIRSNVRQLDRQINTLKSLETKTKQQIKTASTRSSAKTVAAKNAQLEVRMMARELVRIRKQHTRLNTSKAQLESVGMQVREAFAVRKIHGSMKASTDVMKNVNSLIRLPELTNGMQELSKALIQADIIQEMTDEMAPAEEDLEDSEAEEEVDKVIAEIVGDKFGEANVPVHFPEAPVAEEPVGEDQVDLQEMRDRLEQLRS
ncbi:hypothetical protein ABW20_dc0109890 [Dactylellina cionopaga]|nr:hypothetical protein ABW20_dc0109890 [Dactylellina cionopaga]